MSLMGKNKVDFSRYVAVGDSITSGYTNGALFCEAQQMSFSNLLANQFRIAGGGDYRQPLMKRDSVGIGFFGNARMKLHRDKNGRGEDVLQICFAADQGDYSAFAENVYAEQGPFHNFGVPGARALTILFEGYGNPERGAGNFNPFFTRMASDCKSASILSDALKQNPTFFTLFIGNNDVLAYALSGGTTDFITPLHGPPGQGFESSLKTIVSALTANGARGAVANIPDICSIPFFTSVFYNHFFLDAQGAAAMNKKYDGRRFTFTTGRNGFIAEDISGGIRQLKKGDMVLMDLMFDPQKSEIMSGGIPLPKKYYLNEEEVLKIKNAVASYNSVIKSTAKSFNLAFVDANAMLKHFDADRVYIPSSRSFQFKPRGIFSLDGVHVSGLGQALLCNEFIKSINTAYQTEIPKINLTRFRRISLT